jgi:hypothetical protein
MSQTLQRYIADVMGQLCEGAKKCLIFKFSEPDPMAFRLTGSLLPLPTPDARKLGTGCISRDRADWCPFRVES